MHHGHSTPWNKICLTGDSLIRLYLWSFRAEKNMTLSGRGRLHAYSLYQQKFVYTYEFHASKFLVLSPREYIINLSIFKFFTFSSHTKYVKRESIVIA